MKINACSCRNYSNVLCKCTQYLIETYGCPIIQPFFEGLDASLPTKRLLPDLYECVTVYIIFAWKGFCLIPKNRINGVRGQTVTFWTFNSVGLRRLPYSHIQKPPPVCIGQTHLYPVAWAVCEWGSYELLKCTTDKSSSKLSKLSKNLPFPGNFHFPVVASYSSMKPPHKS